MLTILRRRLQYTKQGHAALTNPTYFPVPIKGQCCLVIAHAGGAIDGNTYTNSREAVEENYTLGTRIFELDFQQTSDGHWVVTHDWESWKTTTEYPGAVPPDLATFSGRKLTFKESGWSIGAQYSPISLQWVNEFLHNHKEAVVVTDAKELQIFPALVTAILSLPTRTQFIFQAYSINDVDAIKKQDPSARIILTLYRMGRPQLPLYEAIAKRRNELEGVTLPMNWAKDPAVLDALKATGLPLYLHGSPANINSRSLHAYFAGKGVSGFYLD
jgi:glycerophosphoryl diester phosphodiesterase